MAGVCPAGHSWAEIREKLRQEVSAIQPMPAEWSQVKGLRPRLAGIVQDFVKPAYYPRKKVRSMGRVALMATRVTELALAESGLEKTPILGSGQIGIAYGSTIGAEPAMRRFAERIGFQNTLTGITGATFIQLMSHTCAANLAQFFGIKGRVLPTSAGDSSGAQAIGYGFETLKAGRQCIMVTGSAEELSMIGASFFDMLAATSNATSNDPGVPRPFDSQRDGLVVAEGAACLILERESHARKRNVKALGQILSYSAVCDRPRQLYPSRQRMAEVMQIALQQAGLNPDQIGWVHAHGLATKESDIEESWAIADVFGCQTPVINLKSYFGHTQAACAALEAWIGLQLLGEGWLPPILNFQQSDPDCAPLAYVQNRTACQGQYGLLLTYTYSGVITALVFGSATTAQA